MIDKITSHIYKEIDKRFFLYVDASLAGYGAIVYSFDHEFTIQKPKKVYRMGGKKLEFKVSIPWNGLKFTNNEAEYLALIGGLQHCQHYGCTNLAVFSDSLLVVNQLKGIWRVKKPELRLYHEKALKLFKTFSKRAIYHIPGRTNPADRLSRRNFNE